MRSGLECSTLHWEKLGRGFSIWLGAQETQSGVLGSVYDSPAPCITCDCDGCAPSWVSVSSSFGVMRLLFGLSQALHSKWGQRPTSL